jgi:biopolymer transport protein ExbD
MAASNQKADEPICEINVTPLVDVCLVLVIIFMAVAPMALKSGIKVLESKTGVSEGKVSADENVAIKLAEDGSIQINGKAVAPEELQTRIAQALQASKDKMVTVAADDKNHVGQVVAVMDTAKQAGAVKIAILKKT